MEWLNQFYQWTVDNGFLWGIISGIALMAFSVIAAPAKTVKLGFTMSQYARKFFGRKGESTFEDLLRNILKGMESDNVDQEYLKQRVIKKSTIPKASKDLKNIDRDMGINLLIGALILFSAFSVNADEFLGFQYFFKPIPQRGEVVVVEQGRTAVMDAIDAKVKVVEWINEGVWSFKPTISVAMLSLERSTLPNRKYDIGSFKAVGLGLSYEREVWQGKNKMTAGIEGDFMVCDGNKYGPAFIMKGFNGIGIGIMYNAGEEKGKSRVSFLLNYIGTIGKNL